MKLLQLVATANNTEFNVIFRTGSYSIAHTESEISGIRWSGECTESEISGIRWSGECCAHEPYFLMPGYILSPRFRVTVQLYTGIHTMYEIDSIMQLHHRVSTR